MIAVDVPREHAEALRTELSRENLVDRSLRFGGREGRILIPLKGRPNLDLDLFGAQLVEWNEWRSRATPTKPIERIRSHLNLPIELARELPRKWELIGDVLLLPHISSALREVEERVAAGYAEVLGAKTVLEQSGVSGPWRLPSARKLWGNGTVTIHRENGVMFKLDVSRLMFSSGNLSERMQMARVCREGEVVVDMFAGIGQLSLPITVHSKPSKVYACEINPEAFSYLQENVRLNRAWKMIPLHGDCEEVAPEGVADRVILGHFESHKRLGKAFRVLRDRGFLHYHETCPNELLPRRPLGRVEGIAGKAGFVILNATLRRVKSFAPGVSHVVVDLEVRKSGRKND